MSEWMNEQMDEWIKEKNKIEWTTKKWISEWMNAQTNDKKKPQQPLIWQGGGGGANFPTSDDLQIFFGA